MLLIKTRSGARAFWCNTFLQNRRFSRFSYPMRFLTYPVDTILKESIFCSGWYLKYNKKAVIAQQSVPETGQKNWIIPRQHWGSRDTVISIAWSVLCMFFCVRCSQRRNNLWIRLHQTAVFKYQKPACDLKAMFGLNIQFSPPPASQSLMNLSLCLRFTAAL